jgi:hypothetical protein
MSGHMPSTSDDRLANNVLRHEYRRLTDEEKAQVQELKDKGAEFLALLVRIGASRELSLAATKMEEAVFWSVKHVTR